MTRGLQVDFPEIFKILFGLEIAYMRVLRPQELNFEDVNTLWMHTEGQRADLFPKSYDFI